MISVLIPVYNYNILQLVGDIKKQLDNCNIEYEIICMDDCSTQSYIDSNLSINEYKNVRYITSPQNRGSVIVRQSLAELAYYGWLLFLDADVKIYHDNFIEKYIEASKENYELVFGGFLYEPIPPSVDNILRWKYGKAKEEVSASKRNKNPYKVVISANYLVRKSTFQKIYGKIEYKGYGYDNYFGALLNEAKANVKHIDNEVYHLGIEPSDVYLMKTESAIQALLQIYQSGKINQHSNSLLKTFIWVNKIGLRGTMSIIYQKYGYKMKSNLLGNNPSINIFQLYKLCYMYKSNQ